MADDRIPVLFDTDIGSDIDDAVALSYLLNQPRCEIVGITCVSGEVNLRARCASAICRAVDRDDIPIHCGSEPSLLRGVRQPKCQQAEALDRWSHRTDFAPATAVDFMRKAIRERPGEITLLSVGPMTNIGLLFATDPEIPSLLKDYVVMAGKFVMDGAPGALSEWNVNCDPEAAAIAYERAPVGMRSVGLDVTMRCQMAADAVRQRFSAAGGALAPTLDFAEVWFRHAQVITFHDPLAATTVFESDLCEWARGQVRVELQGQHTGAVTVFGRSGEGPHQCAVNVDPQRFFDHYFATVGG
ncbi:MAG TPA: nucleoside hydrolase [Armatimonadetes bacterium]|nr:nucleoside hydrolase [Armatimonadota bacterium]